MQVIDFDAIEKNTQYFKQKLGSSKLCAVLKNDAYGHGLVHVARRIAELVDYFAVSYVDEAEQIQFLNKNTLVLLPQNRRNTERAIKSNFILTVDSFETLKVVDEEARRLKITPRVHIKFDSGMSRLGFKENQIQQLVESLQRAQFQVEGAFSHFYGDSVPDCDRQLEYFNNCANKLEGSLYRKLTKHIANTGATLLSPKYHLDMARVGLGLFGYGNENLQPAKSVYADVISVKYVEAGGVAGYGAIYVCKQATRIAVLNIGYATGLPRTLRGAKIKIGDRVFPIVAICMAMSLIDVGNADVKVGDVATLLGDGVNIANDEVIIYELLCNLK